VTEAYRKSVLPDGIRLITERMPHVRSVAIGVWVDTGSRHEPAERGGISHLIEHLVFKGTESRSAAEIARTMDSVGGHMDAFTSKEHTCFFVSVLDEHLPLAVDLLTDILLHPLFAAEDIEKEKSVVLQEIKMVEDTPDDLIHDLFAERVWPDDPLGRPILGRREVVQSLSRETICRHFRQEYAPARITVAVAGHSEHEQVLELLAPRVEGLAGGAVEREGDAPARRVAVDIVEKTLEQVHMVAGFPGLTHTAPERHALYLLNDIIGGSMSSRLFQEVRERQGLVYSIHSGTQAYHDTGLLYIYAATEGESFAKTLKLILKEIRALKKDGVTAAELRRAKDHLKGSLMLSLESTASRMSRLAKQEIYFGSFFSLDQMLADIDAVREEAVQALIHRLLDEEQLSILTLGPLDRRRLPRELARR